MDFRKSEKVNIHIDQSKEFSQKIKSIDTTFTNRVIARVRVNVPDLDDYRAHRFHVSTYDLEPPMTTSHRFQPQIKVRKIVVPEYKEYNYHISPINDYIPFVNDCSRSYGEIYYRKTKLTPLNEFPKIDIDFINDKINMKKW